ncbi:MAG: MATE family efflux transporter, partial [Cyclobacteriaceae bacterium]
IAIITALFFSICGILFPKWILETMGGGPELVEEGYRYTMIMFGGNITIMLIFLINAIFRGAGDATIAMRVLILSNGINMILDPVLIFGLGPFPELGLEGAAIATTTGRGLGVLYQVYILTGRESRIRIRFRKVKLIGSIVKRITKIALGGIGQFMIGTVSWILMVRISAIFGPDVLAGFAITFRIIVFTILPSILFFWPAEFLVSILSDEPEVIRYGSMGLKYICAGYVFFAYGMVIGQAFNGAGDTRTPTLLNIICYWLLELPLAYLLGIYFNIGPPGIFLSIAIAVVVLAILSIILFRRGNWKTFQV